MTTFDPAPTPASDLPARGTPAAWRHLAVGLAVIVLVLLGALVAGQLIGPGDRPGFIAAAVATLVAALVLVVARDAVEAAALGHRVALLPLARVALATFAVLAPVGLGVVAAYALSFWFGGVR